MQLGNPDRAPKGKLAALLLDGQRRRTGYPAAAGAGEPLIGTASSPGAAGPAGSPDPVPGRDMAMGSASMARDGRRRPGRAWPSPAAADPGHAPGSAPGAAGQSGSGTKGGSGRAAARWPTPANRIPCRSAGGYRELTRCCRACRQSGSGTRERHGHGLRLDGVATDRQMPPKRRHFVHIHEGRSAVGELAPALRG